MIKVVTVIGARPQFVKAAVVSKALKNTNCIDEVIVHTGQHFDANMSDVFFEQMEIPKPHYSLDINSGGHGDMTGKMLIEIEKVLLKEQPDWLLIYGDTNSTLAGALAASKLHVKVAHVEAGLRSFNMKMPEEVNRILSDRVSSLLLCPTETAKLNLLNEGYENIDTCIDVCGDVMYDAALYYSQKESDSVEVNALLDKGTPFVLVTIHRAENTDDKIRLENIFSALESIHQNVEVVLPLHPRTRNKLAQIDLKPNITFVEPLGYIEMLKLLRHCELVISDSGGLQKEAFFFDKYCITARDETEWVELVNANVNFLVGANKELLLDKYKEVKNLAFPKDVEKFYGLGDASEKIAQMLLK
ncbi:UDP-2,3-diacetamido-2,3-dideoxy-D-glucuronate 2-epimerase [Pseudoalteromonas sp. P1-9]|uniref:non-hydrolyzing UDP-N-acetylglucosamine 2-epimerase n=1 Tax=Pseudoalteromonas sp. P1-9 TaxID=1710354 RepID=UPI0006D63073|nr:UDP-N-acetylglucosamine 2-epimerase (non-hydrolyzing) [Pseudoalteromonas sp. P1-9]KPV96747.1 UDP-2,3-diacetamido-2,3-dideoxy-D-glucuronate 2-epimerase [Pseudoalteromonas sp. P1-9]